MSNKLKARWSQRQRDIVLVWPAGQCTRADAAWLSTVFNKKFTEELQRRGYDPRTIKFSVSPRQGNKKFLSEREADPPAEDI